MSGQLEAVCWAAVGGGSDGAGEVDVRDRDAWLGGPLAVDELAVGSVVAALMAAADLAQARNDRRPAVGVSAEHVALSFTSERHQLIDGTRAKTGFAPLSRFVRCAAGSWARTHANYRHHALALGQALGINPDDDPEESMRALEAAASTIESSSLEEAVIYAGGCAAAMRSPAEWSSHPAGQAIAGTPLVRFDDALAVFPRRGLAPAGAAMPCSGLRVLDLTRVIAGPVAGRTLAALGADVLRVDPPHLPELPAQHRDTGPGKRAAILDLANTGPRELLLAGADVLLVGYRPGSFARFGLSPQELAERHPHLVTAWLSAWGEQGPWGGRRGFDSLVQVATGIAVVCGGIDGTPGALPAQALDHATGHLMAAAALRGLAARARGETIAPAHLSLARTAQALLEAPPPAAATTEATGQAVSDRYRIGFDGVSLIAPPGSLDGVRLRWRHGPRPLGGDPPRWW